MCRRDKFFANNYNNNILLLIHVYFIPASRYTLNVLFIVLLLRVPCRSYYVQKVLCTKYVAQIERKLHGSVNVVPSNDFHLL